MGMNLSLNLGSKTTDFVFQNAVTATGNGNALTVGGNKTLLVEVFGTATSGTVNFMGAQASGNYVAIPGTKVSGDTNFSQAISTSAISNTPTLWQFDITGFKTIEMQISAVSGGNITVQGTAVA